MRPGTRPHTARGPLMAVRDDRRLFLSAHALVIGHSSGNRFGVGCGIGGRRTGAPPESSKTE